MNKSAIVAALVVALGLIAFGWSPRYTMTNLGGGRVVRLDRWTGNVLLCGNWSEDSFSCSEAVTYNDWRELTPEEMARANAANQADEDAKSAIQSASRAAGDAAHAASEAAREAADAAEAATRH